MSNNDHVSDADNVSSAVMIARDLAENAREESPVDPADLDYDDEPCGEGMCNCHCGEGHVCGCDCWRCDECMQTREYCMCDEDGEW
ncbi:hypothetical protein ABZ608_42410 [Streptomyces sp. NPDC013172]|uniref:Metallothionein n=1 Tax=Streptomyces atriruber TaxID=545121 RepID=A0ABV3C151_9ACTN